MQQNHDYFMQLVLEDAQNLLDTNSPEIPVAALIVKDGKIIARATNNRESSKSILGHAEINAMQIAAEQQNDWNLSDSTLYVSLEPCAMCAGAILQSHISEVVFAASDSKSGALGSRYQISTNKLKITSGILENEAIEILQKFFKAKR